MDVVLFRFFCLLFLAIGLNAYSGCLNVGKVIVLNEDNMSEELDKCHCLCVAFYAPKCPYSQALLPEMDKAAKQSKGWRSVRFGKVNCIEEPELQQKYGIKGFPEIKLFVGEDIYDYNGKRDAESILAFVKEHCCEH